MVRSNLSILQNIQGVVEIPYPHCVSHQALPPRLYEDLFDTRPSMTTILGNTALRPGRELHQQNIRVDIQAFNALKMTMGDAWKPFITYHTSQDFWLDILDVFEGAIKSLYPDLENKLGKNLRDADVGVRFTGKHDIELDCQVGLNTPTTKVSRVRGPHVDNPKELFASLLYMRDPKDFSEGGDLYVYEVDEGPYFRKGTEIYDQCVTQTKIGMPYEANYYFAFINGLHSVHGVTPRQITSFPRLMCNFIAEVNFPLFPHRHLIRANKYD